MAAANQLGRCRNPSLSSKLSSLLQALLKLFLGVLRQPEGGGYGDEVKRGAGHRERNRLPRRLGASWITFNAAENSGKWRSRASPFLGVQVSSLP